MIHAENICNDKMNGFHVFYIIAEKVQCMDVHSFHAWANILTVQQLDIHVQARGMTGNLSVHALISTPHSFPRSFWNASTYMYNTCTIYYNNSLGLLLSWRRHVCVYCIWWGSYNYVIIGFPSSDLLPNCSHFTIAIPWQRVR